MDIRPYTSANEAACLAVFDSNVPRYFTTPERDAFTAFLRQDGAYFVVTEGDAVRACGGVAVDDHGLGFLTWGMVHADHQRRGLGAALTRHRLDLLRADPQVWCVLIDTSHLTTAFYRRFGFVSGRVVPDGYAPGLHKHYMRLVWG